MWFYTWGCHAHQQLIMLYVWHLLICIFSWCCNVKIVVIDFIDITDLKSILTTLVFVWNQCWATYQIYHEGDHLIDKEYWIFYFPFKGVYSLYRAIFVSQKMKCKVKCWPWQVLTEIYSCCQVVEPNKLPRKCHVLLLYQTFNPQIWGKLWKWHITNMSKVAHMHHMAIYVSFACIFDNSY